MGLSQREAPYQLIVTYLNQYNITLEFIAIDYYLQANPCLQLVLRPRNSPPARPAAYLAQPAAYPLTLLDGH